MALSNEWASKGVQVNAIAPGYIATDNTQALREDEARASSILSRIPAGRWGVPEDFAGPIVFLASTASKLYEWFDTNSRWWMDGTINK